MHSDWRAPQAVTQARIVERSGLLLQPVMQILCSPLHRMPAAIAIWLSITIRLKRPATAPKALRCAKLIQQARQE